MTRDRKVLYIISSLILVVLLAAFLIPANSGRLVAATLLLPAAVLVPILIKKRNILSIHSKMVLLLLIVIALLYLMAYYLTGLKYGYYLSDYVYIGFILKTIIPTSVIIVSIEIIRRVLMAQENKTATVLMYIIGIIADVLITANLSEIKSYYTLMDVVGMSLFPAVTGNILYNYLSRKYGFKPTVTYRLIITVVPLFIEKASALPEVILVFAKVILPLLIYLFISSLYDKKKRYALEKKSKFRFVGHGVIIAVMISIVMLISGQFKYSAIVIATESMTGEINKGDLVLYERYDDQIIVEGQVIVFKKDKSTIIHRVVEIDVVNGQTRYYTKGDANELRDAGYITDSSIIGVTNIKLSYLGYPTLWIRDLFKK